MNSTHSATAAPFLDIVLASTTNDTAFASDMYSRNWSRMRGCPGMSMTRRILFVGGSETWAMFVCIEVCVGRVCLYSNYSTIKLVKNEV